jgi:hypothetical protein
VHSVFERACNIETHAGELVSLLAKKLGNVPHGIRLAGPIAPFTSWLIPGSSAILANATLCIPDADFTVDVSAAAVWRGVAATVSMDAGPIDVVSMDPCRGAIAVNLRKLRATLYERGPEHGIAPLLTAALHSRSALERAFAARLARTLPPLARATAERDVPAVTRAAACLVGLGPGLTPSGDDFLVGYLAALWSCAGFATGIDGMLERLAKSLAPLFLRTNAISRQMLGDATRGRFAECLADVTAALAGEGDIVEATVQALALGHSSGADMLCGLLFGYGPDLAMQNRPSPPDRSSSRQSLIHTVRPKIGVGGMVANVC